MGGLTRTMPAAGWRFPRFLVAGAVNTLVTYLVFLGLVAIVPYRWAYTGSYAAGIVLGYWMNARVVFGQKPRPGTLAPYLVAYGATYLVGLGLVSALVEWVHVDVRIAPLVALVMTVPFSYLVLKFVFAARS